MRGIRTIRLVAAVVVAMAASLVVATPAVALGPPGCDVGFTSIKAASTGKFATVHSGQGGLVKADGSHYGWDQHFQICLDYDWDNHQWAFKADRAGKYMTASNGGVPRADTTFEGGTILWVVALAYWDTANNQGVYSLKYLMNDRYLTVNTSTGSLRADATFVGWYQAFNIPGLDPYYSPAR